MEEEIKEEEEEKQPEPEETPKIEEPTGGLIIPANLTFKNEDVTMSSRWKDHRIKPWNPIKTTNFNSNWG